MKTRNLFLILFVLALPLAILYFLSSYDEELKEEGDERREAERSRQARPDIKSKSESRKSKISRYSKPATRNFNKTEKNLKTENLNSRVEQSGSPSKLTERQSEIFNFIQQNTEAKMI